MPINNITQTVSTIPAPPHRGVDVQTVFVIKQEDFQDHLQGTTIDELNTLKDQLNSIIGEINSTTTTMNGYADTASAGASTATTKAGEASTSAGEALAYRNQAETFKNNASTSATKAGQWADNNYNVEVEAGKYSAKHWATVAQSVDVSNKVDTNMSGYTSKTMPVDADLIPLSDGDSSFGIKKLTWANLKATLLTYFDTLYSRKSAIFGIGQTWQDVAASRVAGITYTNSTGKPISVSISILAGSNDVACDLTVQGVTNSSVYNAANDILRMFLTCIVPSGGSYRFDKYGGGTYSIAHWVELR